MQTQETTTCQLTKYTYVLFFLKTGIRSPGSTHRRLRDGEDPKNPHTIQVRDGAYAFRIVSRWEGEIEDDNGTTTPMLSDFTPTMDGTVYVKGLYYTRQTIEERFLLRGNIGTLMREYPDVPHFIHVGGGHWFPYYEGTDKFITPITDGVMISTPKPEHAVQEAS